MTRPSFWKLFSICLVALSIFSIPFTEPATAAEKPVVLKFVDWHPSADVNVYAKANSYIVREIEKRSNGRLKIEYYWSGSLLPAKDTVSGLQMGVADMGLVHSAYEPGKLPLTSVGGLPAIGHDFYPSAMAVAELQKLPELQAELAKHNLKFLTAACNTSSGIWSSKPIRSIADMKGKKFACEGDKAVIVKALGGVPVTMTSTEVYQALEKGTVDGGLANPGWASDYKWHEVAPYYTELLFGNTAGIINVINKNSWDKIPADLQKMFADLVEEAAIKGHEIYQSNAENKLKGLVDQNLVTVIKPSEKDIALLEKTAEEVVWVDWAKKMSARGLDGQKILDQWRKTYRKYAQSSPFAH